MYKYNVLNSEFMETDKKCLKCNSNLKTSIYECSDLDGKIVKVKEKNGIYICNQCDSIYNAVNKINSQEEELVYKCSYEEWIDEGMKNNKESFSCKCPNCNGELYTDFCPITSGTEIVSEELEKTSEGNEFVDENGNVVTLCFEFESHFDEYEYICKNCGNVYQGSSEKDLRFQYNLKEREKTEETNIHNENDIMKQEDIVNRDNSLKCPNCNGELEEIYQGNFYFSNEQGEYDEEISKYICKNCGNVYQGRSFIEDETGLELIQSGEIVQKNKIKKRIIIGIIIMFIVCLIAFSIGVINSARNTTSYINMNSTTKISSLNNFIYGVPIKYKEYDGYCECEVPNCLENTFIKTYDEFNSFVKQFGEVTVWNKSKNDWIDVFEYFDKDFFLSQSLAIEVHDGTLSHDTYTVDSVTRKGNQANINIDLESRKYGGIFAPNVEFKFIPLGKDIEYVNFNITTTEINNIQDAGIDYKPVIYLYPSEETNVTVKLGYKENITVSYPDYKDGWNVLAKPNGRLVDLDTNRELYSLYYECKNAIKFDMTDEGFVVKGEEIVPFLEEKLSQLGLSDVEAEEFIIYWLPILTENKYNYIRFATEEEINQNMPLSIDKSPDSIIRVLMIYKGLEEEIEVSEQVLTSPVRKGFTVVEWGVTEIK